MPTRPTISILIRTFNSAKTLPDLLKHLSLISGDEIIVVDSGSKDSTLAIASSGGAHIVNTRRPFNFSRSLNDGFSRAINPWVFVISSHCIPFDSSIMTLVRNYADSAPEDVAVAYGRVVLAPALFRVEQSNVGGLKEWREGMFKGRGNSVALYRRAAWQLYKFNEDLKTAEDLDWLTWAMTNGLKGGIMGDVQALYRNHGSLSHMCRKGWRDTIYGLQNGHGVPTTVANSFFSLGIATAYFLKLMIRGGITMPMFARHVSHALGACAASVVYRKKSLPSSHSGSDI